MQQWRFRRVISSLIAALFLAVSLALIGCGDDDGGGADDDDIAQAQALANQTIAFDAGAIDNRLAGLPAVLAFGSADENTLPFALTLAGDSIEGSATVASIEFLPSKITDINGASVQTVTIRGVTFGVNILFTIDIRIDPATGVITIIGPDGRPIVLNPDADGAILLANKTLLDFDLHVIDPALAGELATLEFGGRSANSLDFTLDVPADVDHPAAIISGEAIFFENRVAFVITSIQVGPQVIRQIEINGVTISLGGIVLNIDFDIIGQDEFEVTFTNPVTGRFNRYHFRPGDTGITGITGTGGDDDQG
jgi:hypothetical protein